MALVRNMDDAKLLADCFLADRMLEQPEEEEVSIKDISWVKTARSTTGYIFQALTQDIKADIETTWQVVKDVQHYQTFSNGSVTVQNQEVKEGAAIGLDICVKGSCTDSKLPHSDEVISVVDDKNKILGWKRNVLFTSELTARYHILEPSPDNPKQTRSYIALRIPSGIVGFFSDLIYKKVIEQAFNDLCAGIKQEAERLAITQLT